MDTTAPRIVLGLGNPGPDYAGSRHNLGFEVVARAARVLGVTLEPGPGPFEGARLALPRGDEALLVRPLTYMNRSGEVFAALGEPVDPGRLLVVCDDLDLPVGRMRLKPRGSDGGQRGLRSIEAALGTRDYARLRVGIGAAPPGVPVVEHVLARPDPDEAPVLEKAAFVAALGVVTWLDSAPLERLMGCLNRR